MFVFLISPSSSFFVCFFYRKYHPILLSFYHLHYLCVVVFLPLLLLLFLFLFLLPFFSSSSFTIDGLLKFSDRYFKQFNNHAAGVQFISFVSPITFLSELGRVGHLRECNEQIHNIAPVMTSYKMEGVKMKLREEIFRENFGFSFF